MSPDEALAGVRERLIRMEEQSKGRDARLDRVESRLGAMDVLIERFRWWIIGGVAAAGPVGVAAHDTIAGFMR